MYSYYCYLCGRDLVEDLSLRQDDQRRGQHAFRVHPDVAPTEVSFDLFEPVSVPIALFAQRVVTSL